MKKLFTFAIAISILKKSECFPTIETTYSYKNYVLLAFAIKTI